MQKGEKPPSRWTIMRKGKFRFYWFPGTGINLANVEWEFSHYFVINLLLCAFEWEYDPSSEEVCSNPDAVNATPEENPRRESDPERSAFDRSAVSSESDSACQRDQ